MNEVKERINELKHIRKTSKKQGFVDAEKWAKQQIYEMKIALRKMKKASAATEAR
jgi:hypothetical protein